MVLARSSAGAVLDVRAFCPPALPPGTAFRIPVTLRNRSREAVTVARGALLAHRGEWKVSGPTAFNASASMTPAGTGDTSTADTTVSVVMPRTAREGGVVSLTLAFLGRVGNGPAREWLGTASCRIEAAPRTGVRVLTSIDVTPGSATVAPGATQAFVARGRFSDGTVEDPLPGATWSSDAPGVATVDPAGTATARGFGTARIRASRDGVVSASGRLTVAHSVVGLIVSPPTATLDIGTGVQLAASEQLADGTTRDATALVAWQSNAPGVAAVVASGLVTAVGSGTATVTATHPSGISASAIVTVRPAISVSVAPAPLAIPPDGTGYTFAIRLSRADVLPHTVSMSVSDPAVASVSPASVTFAPGETSAQGTITGLTAGQTILTLASASVAGTSVPVLVTSEYRAINTVTAPLLGVVLTPVPAPAPTQTLGPVRSTAFGVIVGSGISGATPKALIVGTGPIPLVIAGAALASVDSVAILPSSGLTLGLATVAADGTTVTVPVTVAPDAPLGVRQVVLTAGGQRVAAATPDADRVLVAVPTPVIDSIDPLFATRGTPGLTLTVRGTNFLNAQAVSFSPADGVTAGGVPAVSADGTVLTAGVTIAPDAPLGPRVVTVTTASATSDSTSSPANTFTIVNQLRETHTPIAAPIVGVVKQSAVEPTIQTVPVFSSSVGVAYGSVATALVPAAGSIGTALTLTVQGSGLQGVTAIEFVPSTGLTLGAPGVAADGLSATLDVGIAPDAPTSPRTVRVLAGTEPILFANPAASVFLVSAPTPRLDSVTPILLEAGTTTTLTFRGANFQNTTRVDVTPPVDVVVHIQVPSADGTTLTVPVTVAPSAMLGPRTVTITTPVGTTSANPSASNTITLVNALGQTFPSIVSPMVGVVKQETTTPATVTFGPILSPSLGVMLEAPPPPPQSVDRMLAAPALGVAMGSAATSLDPVGIAPGTTGTLTIHGHGLASITFVTVTPPAGVTLGSPGVSPDGRRVQVSYTVAAAEPASLRTVALGTNTGPIAFAQQEAAILYVGAPPIMHSIEPIVMCTDTAKVRFTVRGLNLGHAAGVTVTPPDGVTVGSTMSVSVVGQQGLETDEAYLDLAVAATAPLGSRVVRLFVPGFATTDQASPANTLTVIERPTPDTAGVCPGIQGSGG